MTDQKLSDSNRTAWKISNMVSVIGEHYKQALSFRNLEVGQ